MDALEFTITLTGTRPLIMHSGRLANPMDPYSRKLKPLTGKPSKSDDVLLEIMDVEARGGCWEDDEGNAAIPVAALLACLVEGGKLHKWGKRVERGVFALDEEMVPMQYKRGNKWLPVNCDAWCADTDNRDVRLVGIGSGRSKRRILRARPKFPTGWRATFHLGLFVSQLNIQDFVTLAESAGSMIGLGELCPRFGTFSFDAKL